MLLHIRGVAEEPLEWSNDIALGTEPQHGSRNSTEAVLGTLVFFRLIGIGKRSPGTSHFLLAIVHETTS